MKLKGKPDSLTHSQLHNRRNYHNSRSQSTLNNKSRLKSKTKINRSRWLTLLSRRLKFQNHKFRSKRRYKLFNRHRKWRRKLNRNLQMSLLALRPNILLTPLLKQGKVHQVILKWVSTTSKKKQATLTSSWRRMLSSWAIHITIMTSIKLEVSTLIRNSQRLPKKKKMPSPHPLITLKSTK